MFNCSLGILGYFGGRKSRHLHSSITQNLFKMGGWKTTSPALERRIGAIEFE